MNMTNPNEDNELEEIKKLTIDEVFAKTIKIGNYTFRIRPVKGKELFVLTNTFGFSGSEVSVKVNGKKRDIKSATQDDYEIIDSDTMKAIFEQFGDNYDLFMSYLQFSINGKDFIDLVVNGLYQVPIVETNIAVMYKLMFFVYQAVVLFMHISQQQLADIE